MRLAYSQHEGAEVAEWGDLRLEVGDTTFNLIHVAGHTPGQITVHVPSEGVVFTGDTIFNQCQTWLMTSDVNGWLACTMASSEPGITLRYGEKKGRLLMSTRVFVGYLNKGQNRAYY